MELSSSRIKKFLPNYISGDETFLYFRNKLSKLKKIKKPLLRPSSKIKKILYFLFFSHIFLEKISNINAKEKSF